MKYANMGTLFAEGWFCSSRYAPWYLRRTLFAKQNPEYFGIIKQFFCAIRSFIGFLVTFSTFPDTFVAPALSFQYRKYCHVLLSSLTLMQMT